MHLLADRVVFFAELQKLTHLAFELPVLFAQAEHLPFGDRDRPPAVRVRDDHARNEFGVLFEKLGIRLQIQRNVLGFHSSISPEKTVTAGPRMNTGVPGPDQAMSSSPRSAPNCSALPRR